jgi:hypothetical protein
VDVAFLHQLMGSRDQLNPVYVAEIVGNFRPEHPPCSSGIDGPVFNIFRVGPHEVAEGALMGNLYFSVDGSHLVDGLDFRAESSMDAEDLAWVRKELPSMMAPMGR